MKDLEYKGYKVGTEYSYYTVGIETFLLLADAEHYIDLLIAEAQDEYDNSSHEWEL